MAWTHLAGRAAADVGEVRRRMVDRELHDFQALHEGRHGVRLHEAIEGGLQQVGQPLLQAALVHAPDLRRHGQLRIQHLALLSHLPMCPTACARRQSIHHMEECFPN